MSMFNQASIKATGGSDLNDQKPLAVPQLSVSVFIGGDTFDIACTFDVYWVICNVWPTLTSEREPSMSYYQWSLLDDECKKALIKHILMQDKYRLVPSFILSYADDCSAEE